MFHIEPELNCDFYKLSHIDFFPKNTELIYSNFTPRQSLLSYNDNVVFFGLQYFLKEYLIDQWNLNFFNIPKKDIISNYERFTQATVGDVSFKHLEELHDIGYLPLKIKAVPEGSVIPCGLPVITLYNTDKRCFWLTNFIESILCCQLWKASTSATTSWLINKICNKYADETCDSHEHVMFQNHDFSFRGMGGLEDAALSGAGFLLSSYGTDTIPAIRLLQQYYNADIKSEIVGCSVPASEHSVSTIKGREGEFDFIKRAITESYPTGVVSIVSDSYDYFKVLNDYARRLKPEILNRQPSANLPATVVWRPDSGDYIDIVCGNPNAADELERKGSLRILWEIFGGTVNSKGYKEIDSHTKLIWGDGLNIDKISVLLAKIKEIGFASNNIIHGIGSQSMNSNITRDTYGWACKCTYAEVDGKPYNVCKEPKTDTTNLKKSHSGLLRLNEDMKLDENCTWNEEDGGLLQTVFEDGKLVVDHKLSEIRERLQEAPVLV